MEPGAPCPHKRVSDDGGRREREGALDIKLMKLLGFLVGESRKTRFAITHRISPVSWPFGRYHENPPWPEMAQQSVAALGERDARRSCMSCSSTLVRYVSGTTDVFGRDRGFASLPGNRLGLIAKPLGGRNLNQHRL